MLLPVTQMSTWDPEQTPHPPMSIHYSYHDSWTPPHSMLVSWMNLLEDSQKHLISSESGQTSPSTSQVTLSQTVKGRIRGQHPLPGWELRDEHLWFEGCIYVPKPLCLQLIHNHHDHPTAGHFGHRKTIDLIHRSYHWPGLTRVVKQYIWSCMVCTF